MTADICDADHIARCCSPRSLEEDGTPSPDAFKLRDRDEGCLSVNWLECFGEQNVIENISHVRKELSRHYVTKKSGGLAVLNVGMAKHVIKATNEVDINVRRDPLDDHLSHACVGGYTITNNEVATTLSEMVGKNGMYPAV